MTYLLDNNVVSYFLHGRREADLMDAARRCPLAIADEVSKELKRSSRDGGRFKAWFAGGAIASLAIAVGSEVDATYQALTPPTTERGKGERRASPWPRTIHHSSWQQTIETRCGSPWPSSIMQASG